MTWLPAGLHKNMPALLIGSKHVLFGFHRGHHCRHHLSPCIVKVRQPDALLFAEELNVTGTKISPLTLTQQVESR